MFKAPRLKVERADALIAEFTFKSRAFLEQNPYSLYVEENSREVALIGEVRALIPDELALILGDALHNLRSALDILANDALCEETELLERKAYFPVIHQPETFDSEVKKKLPKASQKLIRFVKEVQPFQEGSSKWLLFLHRADIQDKHKITNPILGNPSFDRVVARQLHSDGKMIAEGVSFEVNVIEKRKLITIPKEWNMAFDKVPDSYSFFFAFTEDQANEKITVKMAYDLMRFEVMQIIEGMEALFQS
jgi:hypothetical protein